MLELGKRPISTCRFPETGAKSTLKPRRSYGTKAAILAGLAAYETSTAALKGRG